MEHRTISIFQSDHFTYLKPLKSIEFESIAGFRDAMARTVESAPRHLVLDFSLVNNLCSMAIAIIVRVFKQLQAQGRSIVVINLTEEMQNVFRALRLDAFLQAFPSGEEFLTWAGHAETVPRYVPRLSLAVQEVDSAHILRLEPASAQPGDSPEDLSARFATISSRKVIVDLGGIDSLDERPLAQLLEFSMDIRGRGGKLVVCGIRPLLDELLVLLNIRENFEIAATLKQALESLGQ